MQLGRFAVIDLTFPVNLANDARRSVRMRISSKLLCTGALIVLGTAAHADAQTSEKIHRPIGIGTSIGWMGCPATLAGVRIEDLY